MLAQSARSATRGPRFRRIFLAVDQGSRRIVPLRARPLPASPCRRAASSSEREGTVCGMRTVLIAVRRHLRKISVDEGRMTIFGQVLTRMEGAVGNSLDVKFLGHRQIGTSPEHKVSQGPAHASGSGRWHALRRRSFPFDDGWHGFIPPARRAATRHRSSTSQLCPTA